MLYIIVFETLVIKSDAILNKMKQSTRISYHRTKLSKGDNKQALSTNLHYYFYYALSGSKMKKKDSLGRTSAK